MIYDIIKKVTDCTIPSNCHFIPVLRDHLFDVVAIDSESRKWLKDNYWEYNRPINRIKLLLHTAIQLDRYDCRNGHQVLVRYHLKNDNILQIVCSEKHVVVTIYENMIKKVVRIEWN